MDALQEAKRAALEAEDNMYEGVSDSLFLKSQAHAAIAQVHALERIAESMERGLVMSANIAEQLKRIADGFAYEAEQRRLQRLDAEFGNYTGVNVPGDSI